MVDRPSAIDVAWSDVVLRVMGLAGRSRGEAKSFFGLSDAELDRIAAGSWRCPVRPAWQVAVRIRNVECPRLENRIVGRSDERRVGIECVRQCRSRWEQPPLKKKTHYDNTKDREHKTRYI